LDLFFTAYFELQSERQIGMAVGKIPWYSIIKWAQFHGFENPNLIDKLIRFIRALERTESEYADKNDRGNK